MNKKDELQQKFSRLKDLIKVRQAFEAKNDFPPYSTYKTTLDYKDVHGKSLLYYAIALGDEEEVISLVAQKVQFSTALIDALKLGKLSIAKWLYSKKLGANTLALCDVTDFECRIWFVNVIKSEIATEIAYLENRDTSLRRPTYQTFELTQSWDEAKKIDLQHRLAEIGDVQLLQQFQKTKPNNLNKVSYITMLPHAASNNHVAMMTTLVALGANINPERRFENSALIRAIATNSNDALDYLLSNEAEINYQGEDKFTPLIWAVVKGNELLVARLLQKGADVALNDTNGRNVFHYATRDGNLPILKLLLKHSNAHKVCNEQDIFGLMPKDYAAQLNKSEVLRLLGHEVDEAIVRPRSRVITNQSRAMAKMIYYLRSQYRDLKYFSLDGNCNGFYFLEAMYADEERLDYYEDTLDLLAGWDGEEQSLLAPFPDDLPQRKWYRNLLELFEQWTNDVIWFQHSNLESLYRGGSSRPDQNHRSFQSQVAGVRHKPVLISHTGSNESNLEKLEELLSLFSQRMVAGTRLEISGGEHAAGAAIDSNRKFTYSDPNFTRRPRKFTHGTELSQVVVDTKIIALKKLYYGSSFECRARFFYFERATVTQRLSEHKAFLNHELPKSMQEAQDYQANSANGYSHLQVAILTSSVVSIRQILALGFYDLKAENKNHQTALDMALNTHNVDIVDLIMSLYTPENPAPYTAFQDFFESNTQFKVRMIYRHATKIDNILPIVNSRIAAKDEFSRELLKLKELNINGFFESRSPITAALQSQDITMINLVLEAGGSLFCADPGEWSDFNTALHELVICDIRIIKILLATRLPDIDKEDDKGNSLIHYLIRATTETACYLLDEIINRKGNIRKVSRAGKTIFDELENALDEEKRDQLYAKLKPLLDPDNEYDSNILTRFNNQSCLRNN